MAKKSGAKPAAASLQFRKEWIFDPGPEFLGISKAQLVKVNQLKAAFVKNVNEVLKGQ